MPQGKLRDTWREAGCPDLPWREMGISCWFCASWLKLLTVTLTVQPLTIKDLCGWLMKKDKTSSFSMFSLTKVSVAVDCNLLVWYSPPPPNRDTPSAKQFCHYYREMSFGERERHMHSCYLLLITCVFCKGLTSRGVISNQIMNWEISSLIFDASYSWCIT